MLNRRHLTKNIKRILHWKPFSLLSLRAYGLTLIELIVVISIISILLVALGFEFAGWRGKYKVESQIKEIYMDLMNTKARALQRNRVHFINLDESQYIIKEDIHPWPDGDGVQTPNDDVRPTGYTDPIPFVQKNLNPNEPIILSDESEPPQVLFDKKGIANLDNSNYYICSNTNVEADYNCIEISATRIKIGKLTTKITDGGACNETNCIIK